MPNLMLRRWTQYLIGIVALGSGIGALIVAGFGVGSWQVLDTGLTAVTGLSVGQANIAAQAVALLVAWKLGQRPTLATLVVVVGVGPVIDLTLAVLPDVALHPSIAFVAGVVCCATGISFMVGAGIGVGPIDAVWVAIKDRFSLSVAQARTLVDVAVIAIGWALGGTLGLGTLAVTVALVPLVSVGIRYTTIHRPATVVELQPATA